MATERKETMIRVLQIMESTDEKSPLNAKQIAQKLEDEYQLEKVHRTTIYEDIKMLQSCGYPIENCENARNGYYMKSHAFDDWEIKIMMDAVQQAKCVSVDEAIAIRNKLLTLTSDRGRSRFSHMIRPFTDNSNVEQPVGHYIEMMLEAIYLHKKVEFQYTEINNDMKKVLRKEGKLYKLNLYAIYWSSNNYYLIGNHDNHEGLTHYRLDRVVNLSISDEKVIDVREKIGPNPEDYIRNYIEKSVNHFSGETIRIEVEYLPDPVTNAILYDFIGKDIKVKKQPDGTYRAKFSKMNSVTLIGWFLQYANRFKIIAPEQLKDNVQSELKEAVNKYI